MTIEIRHVEPDEFEAYLDAGSTAFLERPDLERASASLRSTWQPDRTWAAFDAGRLCGTLRSWPTELTVPGGAWLPTAVVSFATVLPTHRRRGILSQLIAAEHAAIRERGEPLGALYASEYPIYARYGYGPACRIATWTLDTMATGFHGPDPGGVELMRADERARDQVRDLYEQCRVRQPGEVRRVEVRWDDDLGLRESPWGPAWKGFLALRRDASGRPDGYARYRIEEQWEHLQPRGVLTIDDLHAVTDEAYAALWRYLASIDLVRSVVAGGRSPSERLPWLLTNARAAVPSLVGDGMWLRPFDVARALAARRYEASGACVLEVVDAGPGRSSSRLELEAGPDGARCEPVNRSPDLTLPVGALGAAYLGGTRLRDATVTAGVDEHRAGALAALDRLLRTADEPWCSTHL